jgi:hypothetical protein
MSEVKVIAVFVEDEQKRAPDQLQTERSLRPTVIMRKVIQCTLSQKRLENHSVSRRLFETADRQGKKPHPFFWTSSPQISCKPRLLSIGETSGANRARRCAADRLGPGSSDWPTS